VSVTFTGTLREWRQEQGWTQIHAAAVLGITRQSLSNYERNVSGLPGALLSKLRDEHSCVPVEAFREEPRRRRAKGGPTESTRWRERHEAEVDRLLVGAMLLAAIKKARLEEEGGTELRGVREQCAACAATVVWYDGHGWPWERREGVAR